MEEIKYSDNLPRLVKTEIRCCHLDDSGDRCELDSLLEHYVFEDEKPTWCVVTFCSEHAKLRGISLENQNQN